MSKIYLLNCILFGIIICDGGDVKLENNIFEANIVCKRHSVRYPWKIQTINEESIWAYAVSNKYLVIFPFACDVEVTVKVLKGKVWYDAVIAAEKNRFIVLISVQNHEFWEGVVPLSLGDYPKFTEQLKVKDNVNVFDSTVVNQFYNQEAREVGMVIALDTTLFQKGFILENQHGVTVGFASHDKYFVFTAFSITRVIRNINEGVYNIDPSLNIQYQTYYNDDLRNFFGVPMLHPSTNTTFYSGVFVTDTITEEYLTSAFQQIETKTEKKVFPFQKDDFIISINGFDIFPGGVIKFRDNVVTMHHAISDKVTGESCDAVVFRDKQFMNITVPLLPEALLIERKYRKPTYFCFGGIIFSTININCPLHDYFFSYRKAFVNQELVIVVFHNRPIINNYKSYIVEINEVPVKNLEHFIHLIKSIDTEFLIIKFKSGEPIILNKKLAEDETEEMDCPKV